jgi:hypothetical protein
MAVLFPRRETSAHFHSLIEGDEKTRLEVRRVHGAFRFLEFRFITVNP